MATNETYYKSAQLLPHKDGWRAQLKYKDANGKWKNKSRVLNAKGKREAQRELDAWREEMETKAAFGSGMVRRPKNVADFVSIYIDTLEQSKTIEPSTITSYKHALVHIEEGLGSIAFDELDSDTAQAWVNSLAKNIAPSSVRKYFNVLKAAYSDAALRHTIPYNPLIGIKTPKLPKVEPNALDAAARQRLLTYLEIADHTPTNLAIKIALLTGMREGELCGLQWRNVDFDNDVIRIRTVVGRNSGGTYIKEPKTGGSRRNVPLSKELKEELIARRTQMKTECMAMGIPLEPSYYVFGRIDGSYMNPHELWRQWKAIASSLGLVGTEGRTPTFHDLRHTFATTAIASGADVKSVSSILGHTNAAMTLNIYASADAEATRRTMASVSKIITDTPKAADILALGRTGTED